MSLDSQFEQKLFRVLGKALEDPTFADALMADPQKALKGASIDLNDVDAGAAQQFVREMLVAKTQAGAAGDDTLTRAVFAPGGKVRDLAATHGDVHGDGHGDVSVGKAARLDILRTQLGANVRRTR